MMLAITGADIAYMIIGLLWLSLAVWLGVIVGNRALDSYKKALNQSQSNKRDRNE